MQNQPKRVRHTHTKAHIKIGVNWQQLLKQKGIPQMGTKSGLGVFRKIMCFEGLSQHTALELDSSRLTGMASHLDIQKIWIIGFFSLKKATLAV